MLLVLNVLMHPFVSCNPLFKAAAKVVESKRARTAASQDKPNSNDIELETEANLDIGERFVNSLVYFLSYKCNIYVKVMLANHC